MPEYGEERLLSVDQRRARKLQDWKLRRTVRLLQTRQQADQISNVQRTVFWNTVKNLQLDRIDTLECEMQVEEAFTFRRRAEEELLSERERLAVSEQEDARAARLAEKRLTPEEYAERTRERFAKAMEEEKMAKTIKEEAETEYVEKLKRTRQIEDLKSRMQAQEYRQLQMPITVHIPHCKVSRESMLPRNGLPVPTKYSPAASSAVSAMSTFQNSPKETPSAQSRRNSLGSGHKSLSPIKTFRLSPQVIAKHRSPHKSPLTSPRKMDVRKSNRPVRPASPLYSVGSVISLANENMLPVDSNEEDSVPFDAIPQLNREIEKTKVAKIQDAHLSVQHSLVSSPGNSVLSVDSVTLRRQLRFRAIELSPPKQTTTSLLREPGEMVRLLPRLSSQQLPDVISDRKEPRPTAHVQRLPLQPFNPNIQPKIFESNKSEEIGQLLKKLSAVGLKNDSHMDSMDWSLSSGPISTPDVGFVGSNDSWLSHQTISPRSSFLTTFSELDTGTLFSSSISSGELALTPSSVENTDVSAISSGNLDGNLTDRTLDSM